MKMAKSYKIILLILAFVMSTMVALGVMKPSNVYADSQSSPYTYFNAIGVEATFTQNGLEITAKDNVDVSFKNNLIINDLSMRMKLPEGFTTAIHVSLSSFYVNGNPKEWSKNATEGTDFDKTIKNTLELKYSSASVVEGTLNGKAIANINADTDGYIVVDFSIENNYLVVNEDNISANYSADEKIYYKVKNIDDRAVTSAISFDIDTFVDEDGTVDTFIVDYVDQMTDADPNTNDYKQSFRLEDGQTKLTPASKSRVYLNENFYVRQPDGSYKSIKKAYNESYSVSYKACSVLGDNAYLCLVNPNDMYAVTLESSTSTPDRIRFHLGSNGKFGVGAKVDGQPVLFEEFELDEIKGTLYEDEQAPVYVYEEIAYAGFEKALKDAYTVKKDNGQTTSVGLGTKLDIPTMKGLVFDNFYPYETLDVKLYYKNQNESINVAQLQFELTKIGDYLFFAAFTDDAGNGMKEQDFITEKDNVVTNGIYGEDNSVTDYVGNFVFRFEIEDNADIIVKAPEVQGDGFKGVQYKASNFIIEAAGCQKTYKLYYNANINAQADDANWVEIPKASEIDESYNEGGFKYSEVEDINYNGELSFVPTRIGAYKIECTATSSVSSRFASNSTIIKVASEPNVVEVPSKWLENNIWSVVFLSIGTLSLIGIIILLCIKPKDEAENQ